MATPTTRMSAALTAGNARKSGPVQRETSERTPGEDGDQSNPGDRRCQTQAEGNDQRKTEPDAVQRDRGQQDDERGRARQQAGRDPDAEDPLRGQLVIGVMVMVMMAMIMLVMTVTMAAMARGRGARGRCLGVSASEGAA